MINKDNLGMPKFMMEALLMNCNNQVREVLSAIEAISQYVIVFQLIIPTEYKERVQNELDLFNENSLTHIAYQFDHETEDFTLLVIYNMGAMQKESILNQL